MPVTRRAAAKARSQEFDPDAFVKDVCSGPESKLVRDEKSTKRCRALLGHIYAQQSAFAFGEEALQMQFAPIDKKQKIPLGPLTRLEFGSEYDCEQLWEELEMRNDPVCEHLKEAVRSHMEEMELKQLEMDEIVEIEINPERKRVEVVDEEEEEVIQKPTSILKKQKTDLRESDGEKDVEESGEGETNERRVHFVDDENEDGENNSRDTEEKKESDDTKQSGNVEDGFFSWADLEEVGETADRLESEGRLAASESEDDADDDEDAPLHSGGTGDGNGVNARYDDFFDPPTNGKVSKETERALRRAELFDDPSEDEEAEKTPLELARERMRETMEAMEDAAVAKKPWQLRGEVLGDARPKNSALDADLEHDTALTSRAAHASATAEHIEALIRRRVRDELFDDPVRVLPREYEEKKEKKDLPEVSQEKPTVGLGELYAEEFAAERERVSKASEAVGIVQKEQDGEETEAQKEVSKACIAICRKLDAFASLHFTPGMPEDNEEMEVRPNVPALAAEEAIPEAVSDAQLLAPGEVHRPVKKERVGELEKVKKDRKRNRRATKKRLRELTKERTTQQKIEEVGDPELAEKRRAERALERRGKKPKTEKSAQVETGHYSKSNRFFAGLQQEVQGEIKKKISRNNANGDENIKSNAAALKL